MPEAATPAALVVRGVQKQYGGLRPLRLRELVVPAEGRVSLVGFDRPSAESFVNLATGATLPDEGEVIVFGEDTRLIADGTEWLTFVERFGILTNRIVLLEGMTVVQNLAMPFTLMLDQIPPPALDQARCLAEEVSLTEETFNTAVGALDPLARARVRLARALALDPAILLAEHPSASLPSHAVAEYAADIVRVAERRGLATVTLTADEDLALALGGRSLLWNPADGVLNERGSWRRWIPGRR